MSIEYITKDPWDVDWMYGAVFRLKNYRSVDLPLDELMAIQSLIAAAPDLYEALRVFVEEHEDGHFIQINEDVLQSARAALAKAEGAKA